jgi:internalin A
VEDRRLNVECPDSYEEVSVLALLDGVPAEALPRSSHPALNGGATRTISMFLASSYELRKDRDAFELRMRQLNDRLHNRGIYLKIVRWEHFLDAMSETRLQDEYNRAIRECEVFVSLFSTKIGKYTEEEFTTAHDHFMSTGRPLIYTYFKNAPITTGEAREEDLNSLWKFKRRLGELGPLIELAKRAVTGRSPHRSTKIGPITISSSRRIAFSPRDRGHSTWFQSGISWTRPSATSCAQD